MQHFPKSKSMKKNSEVDEEVEAIKQTAMRSFIMPLPDICFSL